MSAVAERRLSLDEFRRRGRQRETVLRVLGRDAVQKSMPTRLHSLIQKILVQHLGDQGAALGYEAGQEIALRLDPAHEPIPDAIAAEGAIGDPQPTQPFEVAIEILSPEDSFSRMLRKCRLYKEWGIRQSS